MWCDKVVTIIEAHIFWNLDSAGCFFFGRYQRFSITDWTFREHFRMLVRLSGVHVTKERSKREWCARQKVVGEARPYEVSGVVTHRKPYTYCLESYLLLDTNDNSKTDDVLKRTYSTGYPSCLCSILKSRRSYAHSLVLSHFIIFHHVTRNFFSEISSRSLISPTPYIALYFPTLWRFRAYNRYLS